MSKRKITIGVATIAVLTVGAVWALRGDSDPQVEKVKQLQAELSKDTTPAQRREKMELVRREMEQLSPQQREAVRAELRQGFQRQMDERINAYFALPKAQKRVYLDQQIKAMEQRHKQRESSRATSARPAPSAARGQLSRTSTPDARAARRNQRLDRVSPEDRAKRSAYFADIQQRRSELGLPATGRRGK